ncbi:MAG TPA: hypothetical protein VMW53_06640 [archaeon]|nr:hypothetical protein [archaeon]
MVSGEGAVMKVYPKIKFVEMIMTGNNQISSKYEIEGPLDLMEELINKVLLLEEKQKRRMDNELT